MRLHVHITFGHIGSCSIHSNWKMVLKDCRIKFAIHYLDQFLVSLQDAGKRKIIKKQKTWHISMRYSVGRTKALIGPMRSTGLEEVHNCLGKNLTI